jgi:hypothetical protein
VSYLPVTFLQGSYFTVCHNVSLLFDIIITVCKQVRWIHKTFAIEEDKSIAISTTYRLYQKYCSETFQEEVTAESFDILMKSAFPGLRMKRLSKKQVLSCSFCFL